MGWGLNVQHWAGICVPDADGAPEVFGEAADDGAIPSSLRRRMGRLERLASRCALGLLKERSTDELVFCSRHGNLESVVTLLGALTRGELISPMLFSGSVHNAVPGLIGQIKGERLSHTAIAAGSRTLCAGLMESQALLATDACGTVTLIYADIPMPVDFRDFDDEAAPGLALAMLLSPAEEGNCMESIAVTSGRAGALALLEKLRGGSRPIRLELFS